MSDDSGTPSESPGREGRISTEEFLFLNRQLASMARLDLPLARGLRALGAEVQRPALKRMIDSIQSDLERGNSLDTALRRFPRNFSPLYLEILRAGEQSGNLAGVLDQLANYSEIMDDTRRKVVHALVYPAFVSCALLVIVGFILVVVVPNFQQILGDVGSVSSSGLPFLTQMLFAASELVRNWQVSVPLLGLVIVAILVALFRLREGVRNAEGFVFHLPLMGSLLRLATLLKICRTLADLLRSGVGLVSALELTANTAGRNPMERCLVAMKQAVEQGRRFSEEARAGDAFPETMVWKLTMAEEKGMVEDALEELARYYGRELSSACSHITNVIGPILLIFLAFIVGAVVISRYLPLFTLYQGV